uniref:Putative secreted peptide n=1 Tax=Anopheles braziliensis TaxID=58242 RepID=A0A2M3ZXJ9_9DIPT
MVLWQIRLFVLVQRLSYGLALFFDQRLLVQKHHQWHPSYVQLVFSSVLYSPQNHHPYRSKPVLSHRCLLVIPRRLFQQNHPF